MSRFAAIRSSQAGPQRDEPDAGSATAEPTRTKARVGKKAVSGYFSPEASRGLRLLALEQGVSLQALLGEAFDDLMRKYGKHPFGER